ncbi:hypothetical protein Taro_034023, partial [Colocasia esculenta]|nr:hypothetical protein [Colocasia esculenta]
MRDPQGSAGRPRIGRIHFDPPRYADPPRSAPFRYADALRIGTVQSRFAGVLPPAPFSPIFPPSPSRKPQIYTLGVPRRLPTWIGKCLEVFLGFSHPSLHPFDCFKAYYLHPAYHYAFELSYEDHLIAAFTRVVERLSRSPLDAADAQQVPGESTRFATIQGESDRIRANPIRPESAHQQTM